MKGNGYFSVTARHCSIHGCNHKINVAVNHWSIGIPEDDNRYSPGLQVLLVSHIFVCGEEQIEIGFFGGFEQFAIDQAVPASSLCFYDCMASKPPCNTARRTVIEEYEHLRLSRFMRLGGNLCQ